MDVESLVRTTASRPVHPESLLLLYLVPISTSWTVHKVTGIPSYPQFFLQAPNSYLAHQRPSFPASLPSCHSEFAKSLPCARYHCGLYSCTVSKSALDRLHSVTPQKDPVVGDTHSLQVMTWRLPSRSTASEGRHLTGNWADRKEPSVII